MQSVPTLSINEVLKDAQRIHEYRGDDTYALTSFLREVETVFLLVQSQPDVKNYIYQRVILNKLQGEALHVVRTLGTNPCWEEVKEALISNFGVKESYHQLYQEAFAAKNYGIVLYYNCLRNILCKINEKYEYDNEKPLEFSPIYAEKIILKTFINNINVNLASIIINRNVSKLREAYNLLERENLIRNDDEKKKINLNQNNRNNNFVNDKKHEPQGYNQDNFNRQNFNRQNFNSQNFNRQNFNNNSNQYRNNSNNSSNMPRTSFQINRNNTRSTQNHRETFQPQNNNSQMEVDYLQEGYDNVEQVNFHTVASPRHFQ